MLSHDSNCQALHRTGRSDDKVSVSAATAELRAIRNVQLASRLYPQDQQRETGRATPEVNRL